MYPAATIVTYPTTSLSKQSVSQEACLRCTTTTTTTTTKQPASQPCNVTSRVTLAPLGMYVEALRCSFTSTSYSPSPDLIRHIQSSIPEIRCYSTYHPKL